MRKLKKYLYVLTLVCGTQAMFMTPVLAEETEAVTEEALSAELAGEVKATRTYTLQNAMDDTITE